VQPWSAVGAHCGEEGQADAEVVQRVSALTERFGLSAQRAITHLARGPVKRALADATAAPGRVNQPGRDGVRGRAFADCARWQPAQRRDTDELGAIPAGVRFGLGPVLLGQEAGICGKRLAAIS